MKELTASLILEKNKLASTTPWIILLLVTLDDETTLRLAAYPSDVVYDSETYTAFPCMVDKVQEVSSGNIGALRVSVANVERTISAYVENNDLLGNNVVVRVVHSSYLTDADSHTDNTYRINRITVTEDVAVFDLGHEDLVKLQIPQQKFMRSRCRWVYKDAYCAYPSDEFAKTTAQTLKDARTTGSPFEKLYGWHVLNAHECYRFDVANSASATYLYCANNTGSVKEWYDSSTDTAYAYKLISGDFDANTAMSNSAWSVDGLWAHFLVQSTTDDLDWISLAYTRTSGTNSVLVLSTTNSTEGTVQETSSSNWWKYGRIVRAGNTITIYYRSGPSSAWTQLHSFTHAFPTQIRIGFTVCARQSDTATTLVGWDYLRFDSGGLATCDYTLDGINGCRVHKNTSNYGGFPAIPSGRLYGV